jgi:prevent-host-death family protein
MRDLRGCIHENFMTLTLALAKIAIKQQEPSMHFTATQAKNRFGAVCAQAKDGPVFIEKDGRIDSVILSAKHYEALQSASQTASVAQRKAQFEQDHQAWLAAQIQRFDTCGLWNDDLKVW